MTREETFLRFLRSAIWGKHEQLTGREMTLNQYQSLMKLAQQQAVAALLAQALIDSGLRLPRQAAAEVYALTEATRQRNKEMDEAVVDLCREMEERNIRILVFKGQTLAPLYPDSTLRLLMDANTNDYINLNGDGTIRATFHNKGAFNMFGTYTVDHGTYGVTIQNIIKKNFTFNRGGTIVFGGDPYQAALNLQAVYTVNGVSLSDLNIGNSFTNNTIRVNCLMNITGQPAAPQVDFDFEMPTVNADEQQMVRSIMNGQQEMNQQVVYLLAIGRFYNQGANNSNDQQSDQTSLAMQSLLSGTLSTHLSTLLSQVIKNDNWNFGANISTGNEGWHNAEYEGIINGRMLNNRLLFNGQFGYRDNATKANPSFIGDFDLQYLLYPNGNLALKVYNQTNDRYFTKSSLNTQGIGIIMKKDFNGLRELFSTKKNKKKQSSASNIQEDHTK